jgi:nucleoporin POM34
MSSTAVVPAKSAGTPVKKAAVVADSPGNWEHPRLAEIARRRGRSTFSERNVNAIVYNVAALAIAVAMRVFGTRYPWILSL